MNYTSLGLHTRIQPSICAHEICAKIFEAMGVSVSGSTVCKVLHKNGLTRKKLAKVALQRSVEFRGAFMANILQYPQDFIVWVDETGSDRRDALRKFGYALRGQPAICKRLLVRGERISAIVAMSSDGVEAYELSVGSMNSTTFLFCEG